MAITIKGIRLESISLRRSNESNALELSEASYALISSTDRVLANQNIGGYNGVKVEPSRETLELLDKFIAAYKADVNSILGMES